MKILVCAKRVLDPSAVVRIALDGSGVDLAGAKMAINPFDEIAIEQAVRLKEAGEATEIVAVSIGPAAAIDVLRTALALGADRGVLMRCDAAPEPLAVAKLLRTVVHAEAPDLVLMGKQATDDDCNQTGQMLAGLLGWPQATFASAVAVQDGALRVTRDIDDGVETLDLALPAVVTADLRLNEPRFVSLPNLMKAKKKPVQEIAADELGVDLAPRLRVLRVDAPAERAPGVQLPSAAALVDRLIADGVLA
jgi:electron transfer flavoprotein beta subunit